MKKLIATLLFTALLALSTAFEPSAATAAEGIAPHPRDLVYKDRDYTPPQAKDYRHVLSNGVVAYIAEDHDFPLFNISITVRTGSYLEPADKIGLADMTGSLMRSGGTKNLSPAEFDEEVDFLAASIGSGIGDTQGSAGASSLSKDIDRVLELLFDMLKNPAFDEERIDLAKAQALQGMKRRNDSTGSIEGREWSRLMRGDSHFSSKQQTQAHLESITREDMMDFHNRYYHPRNFIISASGDFDTKELLAKLEAHMKDWEGAGSMVAPVPKPEHALKPGVYAVHKDGVNQGRVAIGHLGTTRDNPDRYALTVMNDILGGGGFTSRIMSRVRSDEGLAYSAGSSYQLGVYYDGLFRAGFQSKSHTCTQAAQIVLDEINRIRTEEVTDEELNTAKQSMIESFPETFSTPARIVSTFASDEYTGRDPNFWNEYRDGIEAVTKADVMRVAKKYLNPDQLVILMVGDTEVLLKSEYTPENLHPTVKGVTKIGLPDPMTLVYPAS